MALTLRVRLQETPTLLLYQQENTSVSTEDPSAAQYISEWEAYQQKRDHGYLRTREVTCQTVMKYLVDKTSQKSAVEYKDTGCWATQWDMHDEYEHLRLQGRSLRRSDSLSRRRSQPVVQYYRGDLDQQDNQKEEAGEWWRDRGGGKGGVEVRGLLRGLGWMERQLSSTHNIHLLHAYLSGRSYVKEGRKVSMSTRACIDQLWQFKSVRTHGRRVNSITFCKTSPWLVLASYGALGFTGRTEGMLVGWNVKRIGQPELWLELGMAATVVSCCPTAPQLCCVALLDGTLHVYQLDTPTPLLLLDTSVSVDKHCLPVWAVEWRESQVLSSGATKKTLSPSGDGPPSFRRLVLDMKGLPTSGSEIAYVLVSCSEDGSVKEWIFVKDAILCCTTLLNVRIPLWLSVKISGGLEELLGRKRKGETEAGGGKAKEGGTVGSLSLPQKIPVTSISFRPGDKATYLLGTSSGQVLLCRTFERGRVGGVYEGHSGHISKVAWRCAGELANSVFLSASLDDSIRVWHVDKPANPMCVLRQVESVSGGYVDACWCPWYGNLIAGVHGGGLDLWDISLSTHTPTLSHPHSGATSVCFSPHTRNVVVGDSNGCLTVFHLEGLELSASIFLKYSTKISKLAKIGVIPVDEKGNRL